MSVVYAVLAFGVVLAVGFVGGLKKGYGMGYDDADANHDFDRCPHCQKFLEQDDEDEDEEQTS